MQFLRKEGLENLTLTGHVDMVREAREAVWATGWNLPKGHVDHTVRILFSSNGQPD